MVSCPLCLCECTGITVPFVRLEKPCLDHPVPLPGGAVLPIGFSGPAFVVWSWSLKSVGGTAGGRTCCSREVHTPGVPT